METNSTGPLPVIRFRRSRHFGSARPGLADQILRAESHPAIVKLLDKARGLDGMSSKTWNRCQRNALRRHKELLAAESAPVQAAAVAEAGVVHAMAGEIAAPGDKLPADIQWMPPGVHTITAKRKGEPVDLQPVVDAAAAARVQAAFLAMKAEADAGRGDRPYFDFNHDDTEASAWPTEFFWAGDDPVSGGIRAKVEWSAPGATAIRGKAYRRFSPSFTIDDDTGRIKGVPVNMGGLVNRAAFQSIQPIWAKAQAPAGDPAQPNPQNNHTMKSLLAVLAKAGLISSSDLDEASAVAQTQSNIASLTTERDTVKAKASALEVERDGLKTKVVALEKQIDDNSTTHATAIVEAAITAGRIPPQNEAVKAKWIGLIKADPKNADLLPDPNPALAAAAVVTAKPGEAAAVIAKGDGKEDEFVVQAKAFAKKQELKGDETDAITAYAAANPKAYDDYRQRLGLGKTRQ